MRSVPKMIVGGVTTFALIASSSLAATPAPRSVQTPAALPASPDAWMMLTSLSQAQASTTPANSGAQPANIAPPPPPSAAERFANGAGEIIPFVLWFGLIALALTISVPGGGSKAAPIPNSPT